MTYYKNILERTREKQYKLGVSYPEKDGKLYNTLKFFYILAFAFANVMNLMYILGMLLALSDNAIATKNVGNVIAVSVCVALMIAALIASKYNANVIVASVFGGVNLGSAITLLLIFMNLMKDDTVAGGINLNYYWRHLAPLAIMALCAVGMALVVITAYFKTKKAYSKVLEQVYEEYNSLPENDKPEWEAFAANYEF
ncbi:MAG: hypothetical protein J6A78_03045 [Clostridia bacterium]|nr:hypothetical protein [Clostridia bacterium]